MPIKLPDDFTITDRIRNWSEKKYGYPDLPNQFLSDFRSHYAAKGTKWDDWELTMMRWIDRASPSGECYKASVWEAALNKCKAIMKKQQPVLDIPVKRFYPKPIPDTFSTLRQKLAEEVIIAEREKRKVTDTMPDDEAAEQRKRFMG